MYLKKDEVNLWVSHSIYQYWDKPNERNEQINPLSPDSDQHQFSPNNIHMLPREMIMGVNKMITKEKMLWSVIKLSQLIL